MLSWIGQTLAVASLGVRTIPERMGSSIVAMVGIAGVGPTTCQAVEHAVCDCRGSAEARRHSPPHVGQRDRFPRRLQRQGNATTAIEACAVIAARMTRD